MLFLKRHRSQAWAVLGRRCGTVADDKDDVEGALEYLRSMIEDSWGLRDEKSTEEVPPGFFMEVIAEWDRKRLVLFLCVESLWKKESKRVEEKWKCVTTEGQVRSGQVRSGSYGERERRQHGE